MSFFRNKNKKKEASGETVVSLSSENAVTQTTPPSDENIKFWFDNSKL